MTKTFTLETFPVLVCEGVFCSNCGSESGENGLQVHLPYQKTNIFLCEDCQDRLHQGLSVYTWARDRNTLERLANPTAQKSGKGGAR